MVSLKESSREELQKLAIKHFQEAYHYYNLVNDEDSVTQCIDWLKKLARITKMKETVVVKPKIPDLKSQAQQKTNNTITTKDATKQDNIPSTRAKRNFTSNQSEKEKEPAAKRLRSSPKDEINNGTNNNNNTNNQIGQRMVPTNANREEEGNILKEKTFYCLIQLDSSLDMQQYLACQSIFRKISNVSTVEQLISHIKAIVYKLRITVLESSQTHKINSSQDENVSRDLTAYMTNTLLQEQEKERQEAELAVVAYHGDFKEYCLLDTHLFNYLIESGVTHLKVLVVKKTVPTI